MVTLTENGKSVTINLSEYEASIPGKVEDIYGLKVQYNAGNGQTDIQNNTWRLFYTDYDGEYGEKGAIYLKADWNKDNANTICSTEYNSEKTKVKELNPSWAELRKNDEEKWNENEKAAAWLSDTSYWEKYASKSYSSGMVKYAVGAPPVEMFMKSYGKKTNQLGYKAKCFQNEETYGYRYKIAETDNDEDYYDGENGLVSQNVANGMYLNYEDLVPDIEMYAHYWLCSPNAYADDHMCDVVGYWCTLGIDRSQEEGFGICPMVCLSSDFKITILDN